MKWHNGACDPDTQQEIRRENIHAEDADQQVNVQGTLHITLNGADLATIDPNTSQITGLPATLDFEQFEFINRLVTAIKPK